MVFLLTMTSLTRILQVTSELEDYLEYVEQTGDSNLE